MAKVTHSKDHQGEDLVVVRFERVSPFGEGPQIEVVFRVYYPVGLGAGGAVLTLLSATRNDTRQSVTLTDEEAKSTSEQAAEALAE